MERAFSYVKNKTDRGSTIRTKHLAYHAVNKYYGRFTEWNQLRDDIVREENEGVVITKARHHANPFNKASLVIRKDELIVGAKKRDDRKKIIKTDNTFEYKDWEGGWLPDGNVSFVENFVINAPPHREDLKEKVFKGEYTPQGCFNHKDVDFFPLIKSGTRALIDRAKRLENKRTGIAKDIAKAFILGHEAIINYANRYADEYQRLYEETGNQAYKEISDICRNVPENPARSFREALQSFWFLYMMSGDGIGRPDLHLYDYYKNDIDNGILNKEEALELIECILIKLHGDYLEGVYNVSAVHTLTLGGVLADGSDSCNELTMLFLKAVENVSLLRPSIYVRINENTPEDILHQSVKMLANGLAQPAFFCDKPVIKGLLANDISLKEARDYCVSGCAEVVSGNGSGNWGAPNGWINIAYITDKTLRDYLQKSSEFQLSEFRTLLKDNFDSICKDIQYNLDYLDTHNQSYRIDVMMCCPVCLSNGNTISHGGMDTYMSHWEGIGLANAANMISNAMILSDRDISLSQAFSRLDEQEEVFIAMLNNMPKFGNDEENTNLCASKIIEILADSLKLARTQLRPHAVLGHLSGGENMHIGYGLKMDATLDGRRKGQTLADSLAGTQGTNKNGPTAIINSLCSIDHSLLVAGNVSTLRLSPALACGEDGIKNVISLIRTFEELGGSQLQINFADANTLRKAQNNPNEYKGLIVRVAGYSADFTGLGKTLQDEIISRCEY